LDITRNTGSSGSGLFCGARLRRVTSNPQAGVGIAFYFSAPNASGVEKRAGLFGACLTNIASGAEVGQLKFTPAWHGDDPYDNTVMTLTATAKDRGRLALNGDFEATGSITINGKIYSSPTTGSDSDNTVATKGYVDSKTSVAPVEGLLDANNKIKASLLPSFVFGSMRFISTWDGSAKCSDCKGTGQIYSGSTTCTACNGTGEINGLACGFCDGDGTIETYEDCETCGGDGVIESNNNKLSAAKAIIESYVALNGGSLRGCYLIASNEITLIVSSPYVLHKEERDTNSTTIEPGDWLICMSDDGYTWGVINNTYQDATTTSKGIIKLATEQDGIDGTSTTLAMTPKATVAVINEILGDIETLLEDI
jgi:hypothetical protein